MTGPDGPWESRLKTLYDRLGLPPQASTKLIQQAFYRLVKKFDPYNPDNQGTADAYSNYLNVHDAYRVLSDPEARRQYDMTLCAQPPLPADAGVRLDAALPKR
jgi:DnaJ-class molecular chaperone